MARIKVELSQVEEQIEFAIDQISKMCNMNAACRRIKQQFGIKYPQAREVYAQALATIQAAPEHGQLHLTKAVYVEAMLELKRRCEDSNDRDNEVRIMRDLGKTLNFINSESTEGDKALEEREAELLKDWIATLKDTNTAE